MKKGFQEYFEAADADIFCDNVAIPEVHIHPRRK